jgi:hypothetical protein
VPDCRRCLVLSLTRARTKGIRQPRGRLFIAQINITVLALLSLIGGLIYNAKHLRPRAELSSNLAIVFPLTTEEQKYLRRVITGREPALEDPVRLQVARCVE